MLLGHPKGQRFYESNFFLDAYKLNTIEIILITYITIVREVLGGSFTS